MKYFSLYITIVVLFINCKKADHYNGSAQKSNTQIDSAVSDNKKDGVEFLTEFYIKYYGENKSRENIANYVSNRILMRIDSLTIGDNVRIIGGNHLPDGDFDHYSIKDGIVIVKKNAVIKPGTQIS